MLLGQPAQSLLCRHRTSSSVDSALLYVYSMMDDGGAMHVEKSAHVEVVVVDTKGCCNVLNG